MLLSKEQVSPCEVDLKIEVEEPKVTETVNKVYKDFSKYVSVPGFRKGKAPVDMVKNMVDEEKVKSEVVDRLLTVAYKEAVEEAELEPFAPASLKDVDFDFGKALTVVATVPLAPKVELGEYKGLEVERKVSEVAEEDVEKEVQSILERHGEMKSVEDREVRDGDSLLVEVQRTDIEDEPKTNVAKVGENLPDFDEGLRGMKLGEEKVIEVDYPEEYDIEDLKGRKVGIKVAVKEIHEMIVPELTDEWVKEKFAPDTEGDKEEDAAEEDKVDTVDKLKGKIREAMEKASEDVADREVRNSIIEKVSETSTVDFPSVMVEDGVEQRMKELSEELKQRQVSIEDYLSYRKITQEELVQNFEEEEKKAIRTSLILREIVDKENIEVEDKDVDEEIAATAQERGVPVETMKAFIDSKGGKDMMKNRALQKKLMDFLTKASNIKNVG